MRLLPNFLLCFGIVFVALPAINKAPAVDYVSGQVYSIPITGSESLNIPYSPASPPATQAGDISGTGTLTVVGPAGGTLRLRGANTAFTGSVNFQSGVLDFGENSNLFGQMSSFLFMGTGLGVDQPIFQVAENAHLAIDGAGGATQRIAVGAGYTGGFSLGDNATLTFRNNSQSTNNSMGSALYLDQGATLTLTAGAESRYLFQNNIAGYGGAISNRGGILDLEHADFVGNSTRRYYGGAIDNTRGEVSIDDATFQENKAENGGAYYQFAGQGTITGSAFLQNQATFNAGGAVYVTSAGGASGTLTIADSSFTQNSAQGYAGAIYSYVASTANLVVTSVTNSTFTQNTSSGAGGAIYNGNTTVNLESSVFNANTSNNDGGAVWSNNILTAEDTEFRGNQSRRNGGAIHVTSSSAGNPQTDLDGVTFIDNNARGGNGGAIFHQNGTLTLTDVDFTGNTASGRGGAVYFWNGALNQTVSDGVTSVYSGNAMAGRENSIYLYATRGNVDAKFSVGVGATLDMRDPMRGEAGDDFFGDGAISIVKDGDGTWRLGGDSVFLAGTPTGKTSISIDDGMLSLYGEGGTPPRGSGANTVTAGTIHLEGAGSAFTLKSGTILRAAGGNAITITDDASDPFSASASGQGTITLEGGSSLQIDLSGASADSPVLSFKSDAFVMGGTITLDLVSFARNSTEYVLVRKDDQTNQSFSSFINAADLKIRGNALANTRASGGVTLDVRDDEILIHIAASTGNEILEWDVNSTTGNWNLSETKWADAGSGATGTEKFLIGDVVNFSGVGRAVVITETGYGVEASGMYVGGTGDQTFSGESITTRSGSWMNPDTPEAVSGKLVLGKLAAADGSVVDAHYSGTVDFSGITGRNEFREGIDIHSGSLRITSFDQINPGLGMLRFLADSGAASLGGVHAAIAGNGDVNAQAAAARLTGDLPTLKFNADMTIDGLGGDDQRLVYAGAYAGSYHVEGAHTLTLKNSYVLQTTPAPPSERADGGILHVSSDALMVLTTEPGGAYSFTENATAYRGGAVANMGTLYVENATFDTNRSRGDGGAAVNQHILAMRNVTHANNEAGGRGGALANIGGTLSVDQGRFTRNTAGEMGGAVYSETGGLSIVDGVFTGNRSYESGGAVAASGSVTLGMSAGFTSLFSGNADLASRNSLYLFGDADLTVTQADGLAVLDMRDPMRGEAESAVTIDMAGPGTWKLGGTSIFEGETAFTVQDGALYLYRRDETARASTRDAASTVGDGKLRLLGAGSTFTLGDGASQATLIVNGSNEITASGGIVLNDNARVEAGEGVSGLTRLLFSDAVLRGEVEFAAAAGRTLVLDGLLTGAGDFVKTGAGAMTLAKAGNTFDRFAVDAGVIGLTVGDTVNVTANQATFAPGVGLNISGFTGGVLGREYTVVQSASPIATLPAATVGGAAALDFITADVRFGDGNRSIVASAELAWYDGAVAGGGVFSQAHGTFTLDNASQYFELGTVLADRTGVFASGWDGVSLTKRGDGILLLSGANTYTGTTDVQGGTLAVSSLSGTGLNAAGTGAVAIAEMATLALDIDAANGGDYHKSLTGAGTLAKEGDGRVVLAGDNTAFAGTMAVNRGALAAYRPEALGAARIETEDVMEVHFDGALTNTVAGYGVLATFGDLSLDGNHLEHFGTTLAASGSLRLADGFSSRAAFDMRAGTLLYGNGGIGSLLLRSGAVVSPGNSIGRITILDRALFEPGSLYEVEIDPATGDSDQLVVHGITTIRPGALLDVQAAGIGGLTGSTEYQIIADHQFTDDTLLDYVGAVGLDVRQEIRSDGLYLTARAGRPDFGGLMGAAGTPNARRAAAAMGSIARSGLAGRFGDLYDALANLPNVPGALAGAFNQLHGEVFAAGQDAAVRLQHTFVRQAREARARFWRDQCRSREDFPGERLAGDAVFWAAFNGATSDRQGRNGYSRADVTSTGMAVGMDRPVGGSMFAGLALGFDHDRVRMKDFSSRDDIDALRVLLYGGWRQGAWSVDAHAGYAKHWHDTERKYSIGRGLAVFSGKSGADYHDNLFSLGAAVSREYAWANGTLVPSLGLNWAYLHTPGFRESGSRYADLETRSAGYHSLEVPLGATWRGRFEKGDMRWTPEVRAFYVGEFGNGETVTRTAFRPAPGIVFDAKSGALGRHRLRLGAGVEANWRDTISFALNYDYECGRRLSAHEVTFNVAWSW